VLHREAKFHWIALLISLQAGATFLELRFVIYEHSYRQDASSGSASAGISRCLCNVTFPSTSNLCVFEIHLNVILSFVPT
jgi:hypothetical protein